MSEISQLHQLLKTELNDWTLRSGYYLQLDHGLMGVFPALMRHTRKVVVCLREDLIRNVAAHLPARPFKVSYDSFLVNEKTRVAFSLSGLSSIPEEAFKRGVCRLLTDEEFQVLVGKRRQSPFMWAPGLLRIR